MIISNSQKYIFVHIPKSGGTTVSDSLSPHLLPQDISLAVHPHRGWKPFLDAYREKFGLHKHSTAKEIAGGLGKENFKGYHVFAFVRNPFARAYSAYTFTRKMDAIYRPESDRYKDIKDMNFTDFLKSKYVSERPILQAQPQIRWVFGAPKEITIYKLEDIDKSLGDILYRFHCIKNNAPAQRKNPSTNIDDWKRMD